ncbi:hypothetical protein [Nostoc sp. CMAA1605]|nr:hypothetical protein [Nostoc sp. CMAA1605]
MGTGDTSTSSVLRWGLGTGDWEIVRNRLDYQCPMPHALCPMPHSPCPIP